MIEIIVQAEDRFPEKLRSTDEDTAGEQHRSRQFVVEPKHGIIGLNWRELEQLFEHIGHQQLVHL